jgi:integrase
MTQTNDVEPLKKRTVWKRTSVSNLLRNGESGKYYCRVKVGGKQKWKALDTDVLSVAKLRLSDTEKQLREQAKTVQSANGSGDSSSLTVQRFIESFLHKTKINPALADGSKLRREIAVKAIIKTWPDLPARDVRRVTKLECEGWGERAISQGTGFMPPGTKKPAKKGMSPSAFNKCLDALRAVFELARKEGVIYANPAAEVQKAEITAKRLHLPSTEQFREMVKLISSAGARQSRDCADFVRFLAFSGVRVGEAADLRWSHVDLGKDVLTVPGTKSETSNRTIPLFPSLRDLIHEMRDRRSAENEELGAENDKPNSPILRVNECAGALQSAYKALGIDPLTHHDLRHLFATRCIESGVDIPTVSRWLGHSDGGALLNHTNEKTGNICKAPLE